VKDTTIIRNHPRHHLLITIVENISTVVVQLPPMMSAHRRWRLFMPVTIIIIITGDLHRRRHRQGNTTN
jgi:hypothetical protein